MIQWIDDHIPAVWQHIILCWAIFAIALVAAWWDPILAAALVAVAWNTSREIRDAQKGSGFGWGVLLLPNISVLAAWAVYRWL
jgi:hypothetical protein